MTVAYGTCRPVPRKPFLTHNNVRHHALNVINSRGSSTDTSVTIPIVADYLNVCRNSGVTLFRSETPSRRVSAQCAARGKGRYRSRFDRVVEGPREKPESCALHFCGFFVTHQRAKWARQAKRCATDGNPATPIKSTSIAFARNRTADGLFRVNSVERDR